jgi:ribulose-5-phosphate 4-epimerase/fuculose-1-phosphate aldolase
LESNDGYIKFECRWQKSPALSEGQVSDLAYWRNQIWKLGLIGVYSDGVGYGNISQRLEGNRFIISASQTGALETLSPAHFTLVSEFDFRENWIECAGPMRASSESLTHAACYAGNGEVHAVIHAHHRLCWERLLDKGQSTPMGIEYGTPEMASALFGIARRASSGVVAMAGHREGIIAFGRNLKETADIISAQLREI